MSKQCLLLLFLLVLAPVLALAQFGNTEGDLPIEITADGNTRFEGGVAIAENNVQIHYGDYSVFCDYAEYNPETKDVLLVGNIRLYTPNELITGQRVLLNLETKKMQSIEVAGARAPMFFGAFSLQAPSAKEIHVRDALASTDDSSQPAFYVKAKSLRVYPDSRVVFTGTTLYLKDIPVFWFPYLWANTDGMGFEFLPGYDSRWGVYAQSAYSFPLSEEVTAKVRLDFRSALGAAVGLDLKSDYGKNKRSYGELTIYMAGNNATDLLYGGVSKEHTSRYRVSLQHRLFLTDDIYVTADINLLSDSQMLQDFYPNDFMLNPRPDSNFSITKWNPFYTVTLLQRWQVNNFFETTEKKPMIAFDFKQHRIFGLPVYYDGETTVGEMKRAFSKLAVSGQSELPDYRALRADSFHQITVPVQLFGWLNLTPRAGLRATYYSKTGSFYESDYDPLAISLDGEAKAYPTRMVGGGIPNEATPYFVSGEAKMRVVGNIGIEASAKFSRTYEKIQSRLLGLDGLRHIVEPYVNFSYVNNLGPAPDEILQFDRLVQTTQPLPITFPEFGAIDAIDTWAIARIGMRNRYQTRRDQKTYQWLSIDTFFDVNLINPYTDKKVSNVYNIVKLRPVKWLQLDVTQQAAIFEKNFTEWGVGLSVMPTSFWSMRLASRYIKDHPDFADNSQISFSTYYRVNENWALSIYEQFETISNTWQYQRYMVHRDLSNWVASLGLQLREDQSRENKKRDVGVVFSLTLKDAPQVTLPFQFSMGQSAVSPSAD